MWFVVELPGGPIKYPLRHGEVITLGREASQNIVIEDKTLSRNHLVMRRNGDVVTVQVLGLNGLVYANQVYKSTTLEMMVPASLAIGNVACKIEKKYDSDATILMSEPASVARQTAGAGLPPGGTFADRHPVAPSFSQSPLSNGPPLGENRPFSGLPPEAEKSPFPGSQPIPPAFTAGQQPTGAPPGSYSPPSYVPESHDPRMGGQSEFSSAKPPLYGREEKTKGNNKMLIIGGSAGAAILVLALAAFFWLRSPSQINEPPPPLPLPSSPSVVQPAAESCASGQGSNNLYAKYLSKAKKYFEEGNTKDACDYLKDIPPSSACWNEAVDLSKKINGCKLE